MKQNIIKLLFVLFLGSCSAPKKDMQVEVFVKDLKKGTLYLERVQDSILVAVDSMQITQEKPIVLEATWIILNCFMFFWIETKLMTLTVEFHFWRSW